MDTYGSFDNQVSVSEYTVAVSVFDNAHNFGVPDSVFDAYTLSAQQGVVLCCF